MLHEASIALHQLSPERFRSRDLVATQDYATQLFRPHSLTPVDGRDEVNADIVAFRGRALTMAVIGHGADVDLDVGRFKSCFHINIAMSGVLQSKVESEHFRTVPGQAMLFNTHHNVRMFWAHNTVQLAVRIDKQAMEDKLRQSLGHELESPLNLVHVMDVTDGLGARWVMSIIEALKLYASVDSPILRDRLVIDFENLLMGQILYTHPNNYTEELLGGRTVRLPRTAEKARTYILDHLAEPITVDDIAAATGVSVRTLQTTFNDQFGLSPMNFVRQERLTRVHTDLVKGKGSVSDTAHRWGISHLPRFATAYRLHYGCLPSETLARARTAL